MRPRSTVAIVLLLLAGGGRLLAQDTPLGILERAIQAHGGMERLQRLRADKVRVKGTVHLLGKTVAFEGETMVQLPDRFKHVMQATIDGKTYLFVQVLNRQQAWVTFNGQPKTVEPATLHEMRETFRVNQAVRLVPLLTDRSFTLHVVPEVRINDRPAVGLRVVAREGREIKLYFDKETALLVKTEHVLDDAAGKTLIQENYYGDYRNADGYIRPMKMTAFRKGEKILDAEVVDVKMLPRIEDAEFAQP